MKFSLVIPIYNVAPYLRECLDSVLAQDFENWECVAVDDESTDEGPRILDEYAAKDKRIHVIHQKNKGEGGARNSGISAAKGEWLFFLDGDDMMAQGALRYLNQLIEANPHEKLIRFGYEQYHDGMRWKPSCACASVVRKEISRRILMADFYTYVWQHLYRRDVIEGLKFKRYKRGCDRVFVDDVLLNRVNSFVETSAILYGYRQRQSSAMNSVPSEQVLIDELDHRIEIMKLIDGSNKRVKYAGSRWFEGYVLGWFPVLIRDRADRARLTEKWKRVLRDLRTCSGISMLARISCWCLLNDMFCFIPKFIYVFIPYLRYDCGVVRPLRKLYRRIMRHGEFARNRAR